MSLAFRTTIPVIAPDGSEKEIKVEIDTPRQVENDGWSTEARVDGIPYGTGSYVRENALTSFCYALHLIRRFIHEEMRKGYNAKHMMIHEHIEEYFDWPTSLEQCPWYEKPNEGHE